MKRQMKRIYGTPQLGMMGSAAGARGRSLCIPDEGGEHMRSVSDEQAWLSCAVRMADAGRIAATPLYGTEAGRLELGQGAGGDRTLEIDRACEAAMIAVLEAEAPGPYRLIAEESGMSGPDDAPWTVVVDPLDGSLNAKRGLEPFCVSIAVADGPRLNDVRVAYIEDYLRPRSFAAMKGHGLFTMASAQGGLSRTGDRSLAPLRLDGSRFTDASVELVLLEAGRPDRHSFRYEDLGQLGVEGRSRDMRVRQIGSLALSLCHVAVGVGDVLVAAVRSRAVDIAAGLLVLGEAGGGAVVLGGGDVLRQPLDLEKRCGFFAWRAGLDGEALRRRAHHLEAVLTGNIEAS